MLDEITYPMNWGWIATDEVVAAIREPPGRRQHRGLRAARRPPSWSSVADTVTEMRNVKHAYDRGHRGQEGHRLLTWLSAELRDVTRRLTDGPEPAGSWEPSGVVVDESMLATDGGRPRRPRRRRGAGRRSAGQRASGTLLITGHRLHWWRELLVTGLLYVFYESTRNLTKSGAGIAFYHARAIIDWQRGPRHQRRARDPAVPHRPALAADHRRQLLLRRGYIDHHARRARSGSTAAGPTTTRSGATRWPIGTLLGLIGFRFFPLMPPRLLDVHLGHAVYGFVDTLSSTRRSGRSTTPAMEKVSNQYAAMPSLHCGWAMWVRLPPSASCAHG